MRGRTSTIVHVLCWPMYQFIFTTKIEFPWVWQYMTWPYIIEVWTIQMQLKYLLSINPIVKSLLPICGPYMKDACCVSCCNHVIPLYMWHLHCVLCQKYCISLIRALVFHIHRYGNTCTLTLQIYIYSIDCTVDILFNHLATFYLHDSCIE